MTRHVRLLKNAHYFVVLQVVVVVVEEVVEVVVVGSYDRTEYPFRMPQPEQAAYDAGGQAHMLINCIIMRNVMCTYVHLNRHEEEREGYNGYIYVCFFCSAIMCCLWFKHTGSIVQGINDECACCMHECKKRGAQKKIYVSARSCFCIWIKILKKIRIFIKYGNKVYIKKILTTAHWLTKRVLLTRTQWCAFTYILRKKLFCFYFIRFYFDTFSA